MVTCPLRYPCCVRESLGRHHASPPYRLLSDMGNGKVSESADNFELSRRTLTMSAVKTSAVTLLLLRYLCEKEWFAIR